MDEPLLPIDVAEHDIKSLRGRTSCDECGNIIPLTQEASVEMGEPVALVTIKHYHNRKEVLHFCWEGKRDKKGNLKECANKFYLEKLRRGM